jgi:hypothetical protein
MRLILHGKHFETEQILTETRKISLLLALKISSGLLRMMIQKCTSDSESIYRIYLSNIYLNMYPTELIEPRIYIRIYTYIYIYMNIYRIYLTW